MACVLVVLPVACNSHLSWRLCCASCIPAGDAAHVSAHCCTALPCRAGATPVMNTACTDNAQVLQRNQHNLSALLLCARQACWCWHLSHASTSTPSSPLGGSALAHFYVVRVADRPVADPTLSCLSHRVMPSTGTARFMSLS